ncbi:MAG TPA: type II toxin-antitoxin system prevent-host-death family antitoxin [Rhizomicrobium sp.]
MGTVSVKDGKNRFSELVRAAEGGEKITVTRNGEPVCEIVPYKKKGGTNWEAGEKFLRERGITKLFSYIAPDFDDPLPEDFLITPLPEDFDTPKRPLGDKSTARKKAGKDEASARQQHRRSAHSTRGR